MLQYIPSPLLGADAALSLQLFVISSAPLRVWEFISAMSVPFLIRENPTRNPQLCDSVIAAFQMNWGRFSLNPSSFLSNAHARSCHPASAPKDPRKKEVVETPQGVRAPSPSLAEWKSRTENNFVRYQHWEGGRASTVVEQRTSLGARLPT